MTDCGRNGVVITTMGEISVAPPLEAIGITHENVVNEGPSNSNGVHSVCGPSRIFTSVNSKE